MERCSRGIPAHSSAPKGRSGALQGDTPPVLECDLLGEWARDSQEGTNASRTIYELGQGLAPSCAPPRASWRGP